MDFPRIIEDRWTFYVEQNGLTPIKALAHRTSMVARLDLRPILAADQVRGAAGPGSRGPDRPASATSRSSRRSLPRSESVVMPTVGHIPHLTHAELLARLIGDWLLPCNPEGCPRETEEAAAGRGGQGRPAAAEPVARRADAPMSSQAACPDAGHSMMLSGSCRFANVEPLAM